MWGTVPDGWRQRSAGSKGWTIPALRVGDRHSSAWSASPLGGTHRANRVSHFHHRDSILGLDMFLLPSVQRRPETLRVLDDHLRLRALVCAPAFAVLEVGSVL